VVEMLSAGVQVSAVSFAVVSGDVWHSQRTTGVGDLHLQKLTCLS